MNKQELEELRRLEEELLASDYTTEEAIDELDLLEDTWQEFTDFPPEVYNPDAVSDRFREEVFAGNPKKRPLPVVLIILLSCVVVFCAMKILGVV